MDRKYFVFVRHVDYFLCVYQAMCPGLCATTVEYSPRILGRGHVKFTYVFLIWCYVIVLGFLFTLLEEDTGSYLGVIVLPGEARWHWLLKVANFFWLDQLFSLR